jgi:hypothetical protein
MSAEKLLQDWTPVTEASLLLKPDSSQNLLLKHEDGTISRGYWSAYISAGWIICQFPGDPPASQDSPITDVRLDPDPPKFGD